MLRHTFLSNDTPFVEMSVCQVVVVVYLTRPGS